MYKPRIGRLRPLANQLLLLQIAVVVITVIVGTLISLNVVTRQVDQEYERRALGNRPCRGRDARCPRGIRPSAAVGRDPAAGRGDPQGHRCLVRRRRQQGRDPLLASEPGNDRAARLHGPLAGALRRRLRRCAGRYARAIGAREGPDPRAGRAGARHRLGGVSRGER